MTAQQIGLRERKKAYTRSAIAMAAWTLMQERGVDATSIRDIAEMAEVSERTINNYFASKEDLVLAALDVVTGSHSLDVLALARPVDEPPVTAVRRALAEGAQSLDDAVARQVRAVMTAVRAEPQLRASYLRLMDQVTDSLVTGMQERARRHGMSRADLACAIAACFAVLDALSALQPKRVRVADWVGEIDEQLARVERAWQP